MRITRGIVRRIGAQRGDSGVSIIEVLAASLIFMILSVGVAQATVTAVRLAGDQQHRVTALSLAASEIDLVRSYGDPNKVSSIPEGAKQTVVDGTTYTITRRTSWVDSAGGDISCSSGGGSNPQLKRVNVEVSWNGQLAMTPPVSSDTLLAPDGGVSDGSLGTIAVEVLRADGTGAGGVGVTVTPVAGSGASTPEAQPEPTGIDGCTFAFKLMPGRYTVSLTKTGYIDTDQDETPSRTVTVTEAATTAAPFGFDAASTFLFAGPGADYYANDATFLNTYGVFYKSGLALGSGQVRLYPWSVGYRAVGGHYVPPAPGADGSPPVQGCRAVEPLEWAGGAYGAVALGDGAESPSAATTPGGSTNLPVALGVVTVRVPSAHGGTQTTITATKAAANTAVGDPGCADVAMTYTFSNVTKGDNADIRLALPYGTWRITSTSSICSWICSTQAQDVTVTATSNVAPVGSAWVSQSNKRNTTVTLDPRPAS